MARVVRVIWVMHRLMVLLAESGVDDALGVGVTDAGSVVGNAPVVIACSVCEAAAGGGMAGVALLMTTMLVLWVMILGMSSRLDGRGHGPSPLLAEGVSAICGWLVRRSRWCGRLWSLGMPSPIMAGVADGGGGAGDGIVDVSDVCICRWFTGLCGR